MFNKFIKLFTSSKQDHKDSMKLQEKNEHIEVVICRKCGKKVGKSEAASYQKSCIVCETCFKNHGRGQEIKDDDVGFCFKCRKEFSSGSIKYKIIETNLFECQNCAINN